MPESSAPSGLNTATQDSISNKVALALLQELLEQQEIDEDLKQQVLIKLGENFKTHSENIDLVENSQIKVKVILSIRGIEIKVPEGVEVEFLEEKVEFLEETTESATRRERELWAGRLERESSLADLQMVTVQKCESVHDPNCQPVSSQRIESLIIRR